MVLNAVNAQSLTLPSGDAKLGDRQMIVRVNAMPLAIPDSQSPADQTGRAYHGLFSRTSRMCANGWAVQQNIVHAEGKRSVLLTIIKNGDASTLDVVNRIKAALPDIQRAAPPACRSTCLFDQSLFVRQATPAWAREGGIAAG